MGRHVVQVFNTGGSRLVDREVVGMISSDTPVALPARNSMMRYSDKRNGCEGKSGQADNTTCAKRRAMIIKTEG